MSVYDIIRLLVIAIAKVNLKCKLLLANFEIKTLVFQLILRRMVRRTKLLC